MRFLFLTLFVITGLTTVGQANSGFLAGDEALAKYLEKSLVSADYADTLPYHFTLVIVQFDSFGKMKAIKYSSSGDTTFTSLIAAILKKTPDMWDTARVRNHTLIIPFEVVNHGKGDSASYVSTHRLISSEFIGLFGAGATLRSVVLRPIVLHTYGPHYRKSVAGMNVKKD